MRKSPVHYVFFTVLLTISLLTLAPVLAAEKTKLLYHVSFEDKLPFAFDDIKDRVKQAGGAEHLDIVFVVDGPALKVLQKDKAEKETKDELARLQKMGVRSEACGASMKFYKIKYADMLPGIARLEQGSVARIDELKTKGYEYHRF
jgi:intracellular sulfur oxidation DsrE/DsrF family protein